MELSGGKVDPGETDENALIRECREDLGIEIKLRERVGGDWPLTAEAVLRV
jgi:8-oxo-dGTP diphosphatase